MRNRRIRKLYIADHFRIRLFLSLLEVYFHQEIVKETFLIN